MKLIIYKATPIRELKKQFSGYFPNLKIEFPINLETNKEKNVAPKQLLGDHFNLLKEGNYNFNPSITVEEFENGLKMLFGVTGRVMRKYGNMWKPAVARNQLTLEEQNELGHEPTKVAFNRHTLFL